ncbi:MAG: hypothetical protein P8175_11055 [Deltaproteobacteria bacterium]
MRVETLRVRRNEKFCQGFCGVTLKDQPTAKPGEFVLRYRLSGNSHPGSEKFDKAASAGKHYPIAKAGAGGADPHAPATSRNRFWIGMTL